MPKVLRSGSCGKTDILSLFGIAFLMASLVAIVAVAGNSQIRQIFAPKAEEVTYHGYERDVVINTVAELNRPGYDCSNGGCAPGVEISGYYKAPNGRYYAIGGTGNDPSTYASTSLAAVKAAEEAAKQKAEEEARQKAAKQKAEEEARQKAAKQETTSTTSTDLEKTDEGFVRTDTTLTRDSTGKVVDAKSVSTTAKTTSAFTQTAEGLVRTDKTVVTDIYTGKVVDEKTTKVTLANTPVQPTTSIVVNQQGTVSIKQPPGSSCTYNSDCGSGSCDIATETGGRGGAGKTCQENSVKSPTTAEIDSADPNSNTFSSLLSAISQKLSDLPDGTGTYGLGGGNNLPALPQSTVTSKEEFSNYLKGTIVSGSAGFLTGAPLAELTTTPFSIYALSGGIVANIPAATALVAASSSLAGLAPVTSALTVTALTVGAGDCAINGGDSKLCRMAGDMAFQGYSLDPVGFTQMFNQGLQVYTDTASVLSSIKRVPTVSSQSISELESGDDILNMVWDDVAQKFVMQENTISNSIVQQQSALTSVKNNASTANLSNQAFLAPPASQNLLAQSIPNVDEILNNISPRVLIGNPMTPTLNTASVSQTAGLNAPRPVDPGNIADMIVSTSRVNVPSVDINTDKPVGAVANTEASVSPPAGLTTIKDFYTNYIKNENGFLPEVLPSVKTWWQRNVGYELRSPLGTDGELQLPLEKTVGPNADYLTKYSGEVRPVENATEEEINTLKKYQLYEINSNKANVFDPSRPTVNKLIEKTKGPAIELGGPTLDGFMQINISDLKKPIIVTNITNGLPGYDENTGKFLGYMGSVDMTLDASNLRLEPNSIGAFVGQALPHDIIPSLLSKTYEALEPGGILVLDKTMTSVISDAKSLGFKIVNQSTNELGSINLTLQKPEPTSLFGLEYNGFKNEEGKFTLWPFEKTKVPITVIPSTPSVQNLPYISDSTAKFIDTPWQSINRTESEILANRTKIPGKVIDLPQSSPETSLSTAILFNKPTEGNVLIYRSINSQDLIFDQTPSIIRADPSNLALSEAVTNFANNPSQETFNFMKASAVDPQQLKDFKSYEDSINRWLKTGASYEEAVIRTHIGMPAGIDNPGSLSPYLSASTDITKVTGYLYTQSNGGILVLSIPKDRLIRFDEFFENSTAEVGIKEIINPSEVVAFIPAKRPKFIPDNLDLATKPIKDAAEYIDKLLTEPITSPVLTQPKPTTLFGYELRSPISADGKLQLPFEKPAISVSEITVVEPEIITHSPPVTTLTKAQEQAGTVIKNILDGSTSTGVGFSPLKYVVSGIASAVFLDDYFDWGVVNYIQNTFASVVNYLYSNNGQKTEEFKVDSGESNSVKLDSDESNSVKPETIVATIQKPEAAVQVQNTKIENTNPPEGLTTTRKGECTRIGNSYCDGTRMYDLYLWYKNQPDGWWQTDGDFTPADFLAMMLTYEATGGDAEFLKSIIVASSNQLWGSAPDHKSYCTTPECEAGIFNFIGAYMQSAGERYNVLFSSGGQLTENEIRGLKDPGNSGSFSASGLTLENIAEMTVYNPISKVWNNDVPVHWGNFGCGNWCDQLGDNWLQNAGKNDIKVGTTDRCGLYDIYGTGGVSAVVFTNNQKYNWSLKDSPCF